MPQAVAIQTNGKIVAAGYDGFGNGIALARYNADGTLDTGFGTGGKQIVPFTAPSGFATSMGKAMAIQPDGQIVVAGQYWNTENYYEKFGLARFHANPLPPTVSSVTFGDGSDQRSMVKQIVVNFSEPVEFMGGAASAFTLTRTGSGGNTGNVTLAATPTSGPTTSVTITFSGEFTESDSLVDGYYDFIASPAQIYGVSGALDGNGDGFAGGVYSVTGSTANKFFRLFGDSDSSGQVDFLTDFIAFRNAFNEVSSVFDFDNSGTVDFLTDFIAFRNRFNATP